MKRIKNAKGITLIALVITIIVLLILAAITLSTLAGRRGIIRQAQNAETEHNRASAREDITLITYQSLDNKGNTDTTKLEQGLNDIGATIKNRTETTWTVSLNGFEFDIEIEEGDVIDKSSSDGATIDIDEIYGMEGLENEIAAEDLFDYEIISTGATASLASNSLSEKEARITRIKPQYCNGLGLNPDTGRTEYTNTFYDIVYNGETLSDILVIPYQVEIDGELYKITDVCLAILGDNQSTWYQGTPFPNVKTIVYPNTVKKIRTTSAIGFMGANSTLETVVLPKSIIEIESLAFQRCDMLKTVNYTGTQEQWNSISIGEYNESLDSATINYNY